MPPTSGGEHLIGTTPPTQSRRANSLLSETIPRSLRAGETVAVEARLRRADIYALFAGAPAPSGAALHDLRLTHALSARLKAGNGALLIQSQSSETVWLDNRPGVPTDEFVSWRWTMTASKPGRRRVCLSVSARRLGGDGLAAEQNLPDQVVEVRVGRDHKHALIWWGTCIGVFLAGLLIGRLAEPVLRKLSRLLGF